MTRDDRSHRPDLDQAAQETEASVRRSQMDRRTATEGASQWRSLAAYLRRLREENGFQEMFLDAFGGRGG